MSGISSILLLSMISAFSGMGKFLRVQVYSRGRLIHIRKNISIIFSKVERLNLNGMENIFTLTEKFGQMFYCILIFGLNFY